MSGNSGVAKTFIKIPISKVDMNNYYLSSRTKEKRENKQLETIAF